MNILKKLVLVGFICIMSAPLLQAGGMQVQASAAITSASEPIMTTVRNTAGVDLIAGDVVVWQTNASLSSTTYPDGVQYGVDVDTSTSDNTSQVAGVLLEAIADGEYGDMALYGYVSVINVHTLTTIGDPLVVSDGGEEVGSAEVMGDGEEENVFAICFETQSDSTTVKGWLCR